MALEIVLFTLLVTAAALLLQEKLNVPIPISLIAIVMVAALCGYAPVPITEQVFDDLIMVMLPVLIAVDAMAMRWQELTRNALGLFYLAITIPLTKGTATFEFRVSPRDGGIRGPGDENAYVQSFRVDARKR